jgi:hypothetical protein
MTKLLGGLLFVVDYTIAKSISGCTALRVRGRERLRSPTYSAR